MGEFDLYLSGVEHLLTNTLCYIANGIIRILDFIVIHVYAYVVYQILGRPRPNRRPKLEEKQIEEDIHEFDTQMLRKRQCAIDELISSEYNYQNFISILVDVYQPSLSKYITDEQNSVIFEPVLPLISASKKFTTEFENASKDGAENALIGPIFRTKVDINETFAPFISNYLAISTLYGKLSSENRSFSKVLEKLESSNEPFSSLIVMPVQRMPRYALLLKEILKSTPEWHKDYAQLQRALKKLEKDAKKADMKVKEANRRSKLLDIEKSIRNCPSLLTEHRKFVGTYTLKGQGVELVLFNDLILITKSKTEGLMRRKVKDVKQTQDLTEVSTVIKEGTLIRLKTLSNDFVIEAVEPVQYLVDMIEMQIKEIVLRCVPQANE